MIRRIISILVVLAAACTPPLAFAQTVKAVPKRDSALLIATLPKCTTACPDSARIAWTYGETRVARVVKAKSIDTARVLRLNAARDAVFTYTPYKGSSQTLSVAAYVPPVVAPPVVQPASGSYVVPAPPATFSVAYPTISRTLRVAIGGNLQAALDSARGGDEIVLANGAVFIGNYRLPAKTGTQWIVVRSEAPGNLGVRRDTVAPTATIATATSDAALITLPGAARWRLAGITIAYAPADTNVQNYGIVVLGRGDETTLAAMPSDIVLDRVWIHSSTNAGTSRCVAFNGTRLAVIDSYINECHGRGFDSQGVGGWGGPGPFLIDNNRIEASGQGVMFGGADPVVTNVSPSDITITHNYFFKPLNWARGKWLVKCTFELKHARRVRFEGNVLENHWADAQDGFPILFQALSQSERAPWSTVADVVVRNNYIKNATNAVNLLARYSALITSPTSRILITNNLFENVGRDPISGEQGQIMQLLGGVRDVTITNNTVTLSTGVAQKVLSFAGRDPTVRLQITDNLFPVSSYGIVGDSGMPVSVFAPDGIIARNVTPIRNEPAPSTTAAGADIAVLNAAIVGVVR